MKSVSEFHNKKLLNEFYVPIASELLYSLVLVSGLVYVFFKIVQMIYIKIKGISDVSKNEAKLLKEISKKVSLIVNDEIECYLITKEKNNLDAFINGSNKAFMTKGLYDILTEREVISVFLHEYAHYKNKHIYKTVGFEATVGFFSITCINFITLYFIGLLIPFLTLILMTTGFNFSRILSQKQELEADKFVAEKGYGKDLASSLKKLEKYIKEQICRGITKIQCDKLLDKLHETSEHPNFKTRYENILQSKPVLALAKKLITSASEVKYDTIFNFFKGFFKDDSKHEVNF